MNPLISWVAKEHFKTDKNNDWYWSVGIITITASALAFIFGNFIFGVLIIVGVVSLIIHGKRENRDIYCEINDRGVVVDNVLYPFLTLESFWIDAEEYPSKIILKSLKTFSPYIIVHIDEVDPEQVRDILLNYIAEKEHHESVFQKILERFGF